ncbi:ribosome maturation factor RimM [Fulvivirga sp.]|uniref:ribosome maturation factor RimM n=1 Tax=Fulvivirga sp. TaxID=1931237 RepID=UPI0032EE54F7
MNIDACYQLGYVIKKHGVKGEVSVLLDVDFPEEYSELESVFVEINQKLVPFFIETIQIRDDKAVIKFEDIDDGPAADELKAKRVFLPLSTLPELDPGKFYYHQVVGYTVKDQKLGEVGIITGIFTSNMQDLITVDYDGTEILIPINDDIVHDADHENKILNVDLPEGLMDVYLS